MSPDCIETAIIFKSEWRHSASDALLASRGPVPGREVP